MYFRTIHRGDNAANQVRFVSDSLIPVDKMHIAFFSGDVVGRGRRESVCQVQVTEVYSMLFNLASSTIITHVGCINAQQPLTV
jgi:hypothetical protein